MRTYAHAALLALSLSLVLSRAPQRACGETPIAGVERTCRSGRWFIVETASFQVCCTDQEATAESLARWAEALRVELSTKWLGDCPATASAWNPKCQIVLHPDLSSYVAAVGRGGEHTVGSSLVKTEDAHIASRQIDLLATGDFLTAALPHEMTHVILRDRFLTPLPRWADEGMALLADSAGKQGRHLADLKQGLDRHVAFDAGALLTMTEYPPAERVGVFYGQSVSLTDYLVQQRGPAVFVSFVERAVTSGYDLALREYYGIADVGQLDRAWRQQQVAAASPHVPLITIQVAAH